MSKATKHKAKRWADNPKLLPTETLEQRAQADLSRQNYRRAKEWLKELCRRSNEQYLPQLVQCYEGLAKQMLEKGQRAEAKTVFDQIRFLIGDKADPSLEAQLAIQSGGHAAAGFIERRSQEGKPFNAGDARVMADALVLAFADHPDLKEGNPELHGELMAVGRALEYVCAERFADALSELKRIGLHSLFSCWRIFIKGLCAFYTGDDSRARQAFSRLGSEPLLSKAARPFLFILDNHTASLSKDEPKEPLLMQVCAVLNRRDLEHVLPRAEYLWRVRRYNNSYEHIARTLTGFPSEEPGLLRTLSRFYFNAVFQMDGRQMEKYFKSICYIAGKKKKNLLDNLLFARVRNLCLDADETIPDHETIELWEEFLVLYERVHGENLKLRALVYAHLGDKFSREEEGDPFQSILGRKRQKAEIRSFRRAEQAYQNSLKLNSADKEVHLSLLHLYEKAGEVSKRNKKLDEISRLFPDDKETLVKNGHFCIERKSFIKGIEYLKRAATLDPLDRQIKEGLCIAYIKTARHFAGKGEPGRRYREFMGEAMGLAEAGLDNINLGLPYLKVRLAIFEWISGCDQQGGLLLEDVVSTDDGAPQVMYFAYLIGRIYEAPAQHVSRLEKQVKEVFENPAPAVAAAFTDILQYVNRIDLPKFWISREFNRLNQYAMDAAVKVCIPLEAEKIVRYAFTQGSPGKRLADRYIRIILDQDPRNPLFLHFQYLNETADPSRPPTTFDLQQLKDILAISVERNERILINLLNKHIRLVEDYLSLSNLDYDWDDDDDGNDLDGVENGKVELRDVIEEIAKKLNPGQRSSSRKKKGKADIKQPSLFDDTPF
jgi:hypothetical protein